MAPAPTARGASTSSTKTAAGGLIAFLHPGLLFGVVWLLSLGLWLAVSPAWLLDKAEAIKYVSPLAIAFFVVTILAFVVGTVVGPALLASNRPARLTPESLSPGSVAVLRRTTYLWFVVGALSAGYLLAVGTLRAGGPAALLDSFIQGKALSTVADEFFDPARVSAVTVWLHALTAVAPLATVALVVQQGSRRRPLQIVRIVAFFLLLAISLAFAERLIAVGYLAALVVAAAAVRRPTNSRVTGSTVRTLAVVLLAALLASAVWLGGEFTRTYVATRDSSAPVAASEIGASRSLAADRFVAYIATSINNGMYAVGHSEERGLVLSAGSAAVTAFGLERSDAPLVGPTVMERGRLLYEVFPYQTPLTTFSAPGDLYMDIGWASPLAFLWFGVGAGVVYARMRRRELWALLVYPIVAIGVVDSDRILYWTRTESVLPIVVLALASWRLYSLSQRASGREPRSHATPMPSR